MQECTTVSITLNIGFYNTEKDLEIGMTLRTYYGVLAWLANVATNETHTCAVLLGRIHRGYDTYIVTCYRSIKWQCFSTATLEKDQISTHFLTFLIFTARAFEALPCS